MGLGKKSPKRKTLRKSGATVLRFEALEARLALSSSPLAAVAVQNVGMGAALGGAAEVFQAVGAAHGQVNQLSFRQVNLLSDIMNFNPTPRHQDTNLVNAWGIARTASSKFWVAENGNGTAELINEGGHVLETITIPTNSVTPGAVGDPTGIVVNTSSTDFMLSDGQAATVIVATEDGTIAAWNPGMPLSPTGMPLAVTVADNSTSAAGAVYKGLAIGTVNGHTYLFATNFRAGTIDVFDSTFKLVTSLPGGDFTGNFTDPGTTAFPALPTGALGYAPFGIANINGNLYVTFAAQDSLKHDDVKGAGAGFVDEFSTNGTFLGRIATGGALNSPWGLALAPAHYGQFSGDLMVGNFGDGKINVFSPNPGNAQIGTVTDRAGNPIMIDGLWGLAFSGSPEGRGAKLFFTGGPNGESDGVFGALFASMAHKKDTGSNGNAMFVG